MRHRIAMKKMGRPADQRLAVLKSLVAAILEHGYVTTTEMKAKEARRVIEKVITFSRVDTIANRRLARRWIPMGPAITTREKFENVTGEAPDYKGHLKGADRRPSGERLLKKLFDEIGPRFKERPGGYLRLIHVGGESHMDKKGRLTVRPGRRGDGAILVKMELVD